MKAYNLSTIKRLEVVLDTNKSTKDMAKSVYVCNQDADVAIKTMMAAVVGTAVVPAHANWALTASAMEAGAVAIGKSNGVQLTKDEVGNSSSSLF